MSHRLERIKLAEGVYFSAVTDPKFKHNRISVNFITPLTAEEAANNAIVPFLLRRGCKSCPDYTTLERRLCQLYGAGLDADVLHFGKYQMLSVSIQCVDDRFALEGEQITHDCAALLADIAFDPCISEGSFDRQATARERQFILDSIAAEINEKRSYALMRCKQEMCAGEAAALRKYGSAETAAAITGQSAAQAYRNLVDNANIEIMFVGAGNPEAALVIFRDLFGGMHRSSFEYELCSRKPAPAQVREHLEEMELAQSKLVLGLRVDGDETDYDALRPIRMMTALYGGTPFSRLFNNVREKLSLCYYCAARYDGATGLMMVDCGIESENKQKAQEEILAQLEVMKKGEFTDEELNSTILALRGGAKAATDSLGGIESWYLVQILMNSNISPEQNAEAMSGITREQVIEAANRVHLDTVFFLKAKGGDAQ